VAAEQARRLLASGNDPIDAKAMVQGIPTFGMFADEVIAALSVGGATLTIARSGR
jgi:hypothetical protein